MDPRVSICLPNLNTRPFLEERIETICAQSFPDWELIVYDNNSEDGAWEFFQETARHDARIRIAQAPRQGMYANWNNCITSARGEYVYVATSDDTMAPDCLEKLVDALDAHPECDLAHCRLRVVDENGRYNNDWWPHGSLFAICTGELIDHPHIRRAPFDGLLHLLGDTIYTSITQLLIRRSLFTRIGLFEARWGSLGDFNWNMRAGLVANTLHVPETWGGWRRHASQATASARFGLPEHLAQIDEMIDDAIGATQKRDLSSVKPSLISKWMRQSRDLRHFMATVDTMEDARRRRLFVVSQLLLGSWAARWHVNNRLKANRGIYQPLSDIIVNWFERAGLGQALVPLEKSQSRVRREGTLVDC